MFTKRDLKSEVPPKPSQRFTDKTLSEETVRKLAL